MSNNIGGGLAIADIVAILLLIVAVESLQVNKSTNSLMESRERENIGGKSNETYNYSQ